MLRFGAFEADTVAALAHLCEPTFAFLEMLTASHFRALFWLLCPWELVQTSSAWK